MQFQQKQKKRIEISTIPIINIVFLLLIFFIAAGTLKTTDILPINAPISETGTEVASDPIEILINEDDIILNLDLVTQDDLQEILKDLLDTDPEVEIMLKADAELEATRMIEVLKLIRKSGGKNLYLVTSGAF